VAARCYLSVTSPDQRVRHVAYRQTIQQTDAALCRVTKAGCAIAKQIEVTPGRVSQVFGYPQENDGFVVKSDTILGALAKAFAAEGIAVEIDWFYLDYDDFAARVAASEVRVAPTLEPSTSEWKRSEQNPFSSIVELRLYPPGPTGEVNAKLLFGSALYDLEPEQGERPRTVSISLRNARLAIGAASCGPAEGTMLGEREETQNAEHFTRVAGGVEITGPLQDGVLDGNPIGNHYLGVMERTEVGSEPFAVAVAAHRRSFVVADADAALPSAGASLDNKDAFLNVFIYRRCHRDEENRAVLAEAQIRHVS
jgi:hypothetical protein